MPESRSTYELKRFSSSSDVGFAEAVSIYIRFTAPETRTNSNEITEWVDNAPTDFSGTFSTFGFYRNEKLVGFAEAAFLEKQLLFVVDYVVLDEGARQNNVFSEFAAQLHNYLLENHPAYRYIVAEVHGAEAAIGKAGRGDTLVRLLRWHGFHVIVAPYVQPRLALDYAESEVEGCLMISSRESIEQMKVDTYLSIVSAIYFDYYLPWMSRYKKIRKHYKKHLDELMARIEKSVGGAEMLVVNGHTAEMRLSLPLPVHQNDDDRSIAPAAISSFIFVAVSASLLAMKAVSHETWTSFGGQETFALIATLAFFSIFSKGARDTLQLVFRSLYGKQPQNSTPTNAVAGSAGTADQDPQIELPPTG